VLINLRALARLRAASEERQRETTVRAA